MPSLAARASSACTCNALPLLALTIRGASNGEARYFSGAPRLRISRSVGRRGSHSAMMRRKDRMFGIPLHRKMAKSAQAMADQLGVENRIAPVIVVRRRHSTLHLPAGPCRTGPGLSPMTQQDDGDAAFTCCERQPAAGDKVQAFGRAVYFQEQGSHMGTGENVVGRRQRVAGMRGPYQEELAGIPAQFCQSARR